MVSEILMGFDESTLAYDLQRAHSADIWFLKMSLTAIILIITLLVIFLGNLLINH